MSTPPSALTSRSNPLKVSTAPASMRSPVYPLTVLRSSSYPWAVLGCLGLPGTRLPKLIAWVSLVLPPL